MNTFAKYQANWTETVGQDFADRPTARLPDSSIPPQTSFAGV